MRHPFTGLHLIIYTHPQQTVVSELGWVPLGIVSLQVQTNPLKKEMMKKIKSETKMSASILKQAPNTWKIQKNTID